MSDRHAQTQRLLSDAHDDPTSVDAAKLAAARKHARGCPRCRAFLAGLDRIDAADRAGGAPAGLADRIIAASKAPAGAEKAAAPVAAPAAVKPKPGLAEGAAATAGLPTPETLGEDRPAGVEAPASLEGHRRHGRVRIPRLAWALAAAAAVAAIFIGVRLAVTSSLQGGSPTMTANAPQEAATKGTAADSAQRSLGGSSAGGAKSATGAAAAAAPTRPKPGSATAAPATEPLYAPAPKAYPPAPGRAPASGFVASALTALPVPDLLSFDGDVWGFSGWLLGTPSTLLVQVGTVRASLGSTGGPVPRAVYEKVGDTSTRFIVWSGSDYQVYRPLSRVIGGVPYRMVTASPIRDWGVWPAWPRAAGAYPQSSAGLRPVGTDRYGAPAYAEPGVPASKGVALPPDVGGAGPDPVPKWTWWRAVR